MNISGSSAAPLVRSLENNDGETSAGIAVLKKVQDQMKAEGAALVKMIEDTPAPTAPSKGGGSRYGSFDVYA